MIDLKKAKVVLFDFDDTLCLHTQHRKDTQVEREKYISENVFTSGDFTEKWDNTKISTTMDRFMHKCNELGLELGLVSSVENYRIAKNKVRWVKAVYGLKLRNYCTSVSDGGTAKVNMMQAIADSKGLANDEILIIDDWWIVLEAAANRGFQAASPMECVAYIEEHE